MIIREAIVADATGIAKVHVDTWRSAYAGIVPDKYLASLSYEQKAKRHAEHLENPIAGVKTFVVVENTSMDIVGFASGGPVLNKHHVFKGELIVIYILKDFQGRGIGLLLVKAVVEHLLDLGFWNMITWALEANPYSRFYRKLGGTLVDEKIITLGDKDLKEVAFGWHDLSIF